MKYVIIIPDGAADKPLDELGGQTPFEVAKKPFTDSLSTEGRQGTVATTPEGFPCGSDVCTMSLLGYDPRQYHTGRAPLEAAAMGIDLTHADWVFRINLVTIRDGCMQDHSAGGIGSQEGRTLLTELAQQVELPGMMLYPGVSYRNIMVDRSGRDWSDLQSTPPHDIPGQPIRRHLPVGGENEELLQTLIEESGKIFARSEVNRTREELGEAPATHVWPWGQGNPPRIPSFQARFGLRGAMITAVDLLAGLASLIGWDRLDVPGQSSYHAEQDYAAAGAAGIAALDDYDVVCIHVESPDESSHQADAPSKVAGIEAMDQHIVGPVLDALKARDEDWRVLYMPDHYTCVGTRKHDPTPPPFAICGTRVRSVLHRPFNEKNADSSDLHVQYGHELMEYFLFSGLK